MSENNKSEKITSSSGFNCGKKRKIERGDPRVKRNKKKLSKWKKLCEERREGGETEMSLIFHQSISFKFEIDYTRVE